MIGILTGSNRAAFAVVLATFALAGCADGTPSASPSSPAAVANASPDATEAAPSPSESAGAAAAFGWERLATFAASGQIVGIAATPSGYVVLAGRRTVWFSPDGRAWTKGILPFSGGTNNGIRLDAIANEIVGGPNGFLAIGGYDLGPCVRIVGDGGPPACEVAPISWTSRDGLTWQSSRPRLIPTDGSTLPRYSQFALAWTAAVGWDAAVEARDSVLYHGNTLLHSSNGLDWTRLPSAPLPEGAASGDDVYAHGGVATTSGRRVVWQVRDKATPTVTSLSTSADGTTWTVIPAFNGAGAFVQFAVGPTAGRDGPWLLAGRGAPGSTAWFTNDLAQWHASSFVATEGGSVSLTALERWVGGYIALGTYDPEAALPTPVTWLSPDGMTWNEIPPTVPPSPDGPVFLAMGPAGMIGIGNAGEDASTAWLAH